MVRFRPVRLAVTAVAAILLPACSVTFTTQDSDDDATAAPTPTVETTPTVEGGTVIGSGVVATEEREVEDFDAVVVTGIGELRIEFTGEESLSIEAEDNILPLLTSEVSGNELVLGPRSGVGISTHEPIIYRLTVADLSAISVSGSVNVDARGIVGDALTVSSGGSSDIRITGRVDRLSLDKSGSGTFSARRLESAHARVEVSGSGDVVVNAADTLDVSASGSSDVRYVGNPRVNRVDVSGSGSVGPLN
ncbi:MAG: DUF2807 domain-containing protein [Actinobacteria bacterium]|nr:DUF2807 domain-containing protein [Actinomycetota bacterium]